MIDEGGGGAKQGTSGKVGEGMLPNRRTIRLNDRTQNQLVFSYFMNGILTSKYNWWNFFPKSLILQFMRGANLYFLVSTVISCISIISPVSPFTAIFPIILVLSVSLSREAVEDYVPNNPSSHLPLTPCYLVYFPHRNVTAMTISSTIRRRPSSTTRASRRLCGRMCKSAISSKSTANR